MGRKLQFNPLPTLLLPFLLSDARVMQRYVGELLLEAEN